MADERVGTVHDIRGDVKADAEGLLNQAAGGVQDAYNKTADAATEGAKAVKEAAIAGHDFLRNFVEKNPHTAVVLAIGLGLLVGYTSHRPPPRRGWWD